jgi:hypothetical protein
MDIKYITQFIVAIFFAFLSISANAELEFTCSVWGTDLSWWNEFHKKILDSDLDTVLYGVKIRDWNHEHLEIMRKKEAECIANGKNKYSEESINLIRSGDDVRMKEALQLLKKRDLKLQESEKKVAILALHETSISKNNKAEVEESAQSNVRKIEVINANDFSASNVIISPQRLQNNSIVEYEHPQKNNLSINDVKLQQNDVQRNADIPHTEEQRVRTINLEIVLVFVATSLFGWWWNKFKRNRCPICSSTNFTRISDTETDRWRGTKQVTEKNSRGTSTRHVQATYVLKLFEYRCNDCMKNWSKERKEELGASTVIGRFLSGY